MSRKANSPANKRDLGKNQGKTDELKDEKEISLNQPAVDEKNEVGDHGDEGKSESKPSPGSKKLFSISAGARLLEAAEKTKIKEVEENFALPPSLKLGEPVAVEFRLTVTF